MKNIIIAIMGVIIIILFLDEYCVIKVINSDCEVCTIDTLAFLGSVAPQSIDTGRYNTNAADHLGGGSAVTKADAEGMIVNFQRAISGDNPPDWSDLKGVFISKKAIDNIFRNPNADGLTCYFAADINNYVHVIFEGAKSEKYDLNGDPRNTIYVSQSLCPDECGFTLGEVRVPQ